MKPWIYILFILSLPNMSAFAHDGKALCDLALLRAFDQVQVTHELGALREAVGFLRAAPEGNLTATQVREVGRIEGIKSNSNDDMSSTAVQKFYAGKIKNSVKVLDAEIQYRRAQLSAASLDTRVVNQIAKDQLKNLEVQIRTPIQSDFVHVSDLIDGLRTGHGEDQNYSNEEVAQYLAYESASADWRQAKIVQNESPEHQARYKQLEALRGKLLGELPEKLRRTPTLIGTRVLQGCCHLGCGTCFFGNVKELKRDTQPWQLDPILSQQSELPLYKALELARPIIPSIDSANPDWVVGKNKNLR